MSDLLICCHPPLLVLLCVISTKFLITTENHSSRTGATFPCHESGNRPNASHPKLDAINISMQPEHTRHEPACYFLDILKSLNLHGVTRYFPFTQGTWFSLCNI